MGWWPCHSDTIVVGNRGLVRFSIHEPFNEASLLVGTNYFWHYDECEPCGRYETRHICKSLTIFEGYFTCDAPWNEHTRQFDPEKPIITSWKDWLAIFANVPGEIWDEYGKQHEIDDFIAKVESTIPEQRRRQYDWLLDNNDHRYPHKFGVEPDGNWIDEDGFSWSGREFS